MIVAFDVDGTLVRKGAYGADIPNYELIALMKILHGFGCKIIIWSGGGQDYADYWAEKLGLTDYETYGKLSAAELNVDICFDDEEVQLAKVNIKI